MAEQVTSKVVEAVYFTDDNGKSIPAQKKTRPFTFEEQSAMQFWKNVLNSDHTEQMINISHDMFTRTEIPTEENISLTKTKEWVEQHQKTLWTTLQNALSQNDENIATEAEPCLHLLCYMICLCAVLKKLQDLATVNEDRWLVLLVEHVWSITLKETSLSCENLKFLPRESLFDQLMKHLGCLSPVTDSPPIWKWFLESLETRLFGTNEQTSKNK